MLLAEGEEVEDGNQFKVVCCQKYLVLVIFTVHPSQSRPLKCNFANPHCMLFRLDLDLQINSSGLQARSVNSLRSFVSETGAEVALEA